MDVVRSTEREGRRVQRISDEEPRRGYVDLDGVRRQQWRLANEEGPPRAPAPNVEGRAGADVPHAVRRGGDARVDDAEADPRRPGRRGVRVPGIRQLMRADLQRVVRLPDCQSGE